MGEEETQDNYEVSSIALLLLKPGSIAQIESDGTTGGRRHLISKLSYFLSQ